MKIGMIQTAPVFGDKTGNRRTIEKLAGNKDADLWVLPELALTGYEFKDRNDVTKLAEEIPNGKSSQWLMDFCAERNCHAVMGLAERDGDRIYNTAILASPTEIVGRYRKLHLFDEEKRRFDRSNLPLSVYDIGLARIGLMICFDWRFPEAARTLSLRGAQILAHPSNIVMPYAQAAMVTRALENRVFCITSNRLGVETRAGRHLKFTGNSVMIAPDGTVIAKCSDRNPECLTSDIDPTEADDKQVGGNDLFADRRCEFYES
jgi:predicted amidohydrolase